jgi:hypothetical protein
LNAVQVLGALMAALSKKSLKKIGKYRLFRSSTGIGVVIQAGIEQLRRFLI